MKGAHAMRFFILANGAKEMAKIVTGYFLK